jgi:putative ABC transport system permease protein
MVWNAIVLAISSIRRNVMRSFLTVLGIIIGVASVIILVTLGNGVTSSVASSLNSLGANKLIMIPSQDRDPGSGTRQESKLFDYEDIEALRSEISGVSEVAPQASSSMQAIYGNANWSTKVYGVDNAYLRLNNWTIVSGREFTDSELSGGSSVCILGETVHKQLFADQDPVGANLRLQSISCQVIGLLKSKGQGGLGMDQDDTVMIPIHTLQRRITANRKIGMVQIGYTDASDSTSIKKEVEKLMRQRRGLLTNQDSDFNMYDSAEVLATMTSTMNVLTALLSATAAISLLVGGIGIMNIMLVSVTERTREIGVRLAIGAFDHDVMIQFLVEAVVLSSLGGLIGILFGLSASFAGCRIMSVPFLLNWRVSLLAFIFSALVGVMFGFFPARKAARLDPIEALRHE